MSDWQVSDQEWERRWRQNVAAGGTTAGLVEWVEWITCLNEQVETERLGERS